MRGLRQNEEGVMTEMTEETMKEYGFVYHKGDLFIGSARTIGELRQLLDKAIDVFGPGIEWSGFDDGAIYLDTEPQQSVIGDGHVDDNGWPKTPRVDDDFEPTKGSTLSDGSVTKIGEGSDFRVDHYLLPPLNNDPPDYEDYHSNPIKSECWGSARPALCPKGCNGSVTSTIDGFPKVKCKVCGTEWEIK